MWTGYVFPSSSNPGLLPTEISQCFFWHFSKKHRVNQNCHRSRHCTPGTVEKILEEFRFSQLAVYTILCPMPKVPYWPRNKIILNSSAIWQHHSAKNMQQPCQRQSNTIPRHRNLFDCSWPDVTLACFPIVWILVAIYMKMCPAQSLGHYSCSGCVFIFGLLLL